jgi:hypothetical protein
MKGFIGNSEVFFWIKLSVTCGRLLFLGINYQLSIINFQLILRF